MEDISVNLTEQRAIIHEILDIVLDGNGFQNRSKEETGGLPTLMLDFAGHVSTIEIRLYADGWDYTCENVQRFEYSTKRPISKYEVDTLRYAVAKALEGKEVLP